MHLLCTTYFGYFELSIGHMSPIANQNTGVKLLNYPSLYWIHLIISDMDTTQMFPHTWSHSNRLIGSSPWSIGSSVQLFHRLIYTFTYLSIDSSIRLHDPTPYLQSTILRVLTRSIHSLKYRLGPWHSRILHLWEHHHSCFLSTRDEEKKISN